MWIVDRQRYWAFIKAYFICFTALVGLYVVIDAFSNLDEFSKRADGAVEMFSVMGWFYLVHMSEFYDRLCGVIAMMAAIFTVTWMQKNNELIALLAAGVSTQRVIRPVIVASVAVSGLAVLNQEWVIPTYADELQRTHDDDGSRRVLHISIKEDSNDIVLHGTEADRPTQTVLAFNVTFPVEVFGRIGELEAAQGRYFPPDAKDVPRRGGWLLRGAKLNLRTDGVEPRQDVLVKLDGWAGFPPPYGEVKELGRDTYFLYSDITFKSLARDRNWYRYATTLDLIKGLNDRSNDKDKADIAVFLHGRVLRACQSLALLCVSLPLVLGGFGRNMFINLGMSLGTSALFYGAVFMAQYLGSHDVLSPEMSAWGPLMLFGSFAAARWGAIRT